MEKTRTIMPSRNVLIGKLADAGLLKREDTQTRYKEQFLYKRFVELIAEKSAEPEKLALAWCLAEEDTLKEYKDLPPSPATFLWDLKFVDVIRALVDRGLAEKVIKVFNNEADGR